MPRKAQAPIDARGEGKKRTRAEHAEHHRSVHPQRWKMGAAAGRVPKCGRTANAPDGRRENRRQVCAWGAMKRRGSARMPTR